MSASDKRLRDRPVWLRQPASRASRTPAGRQRGLNMIELMVALAVGMVVVGGTTGIYLTTLRGNTYNLQLARLNQELRGTADIIAYEIRRAGFSGLVDDPAGNAFMQRTGTLTDINIPSADCVMFAYDNHPAVLDGVLSSTDDEIRGFRLNNGVVQMLRSGATSTANCNGNWEPLTGSAAVVVTALQFSFTGSKCLNATQTELELGKSPPGNAVTWTSTDATTPACALASGTKVSGDILVETRYLTITLQGRSNTANLAEAQTLQLSETIRLRNDRVFAAP